LLNPVLTVTSLLCHNVNVIIIIIIIIHFIYIALFLVLKVASHTIKSFNENSKE